MRYDISTDLVSAIAARIEHTGKEECFVLFGHPAGDGIHVCAFMPVPNRATHPRADFAIEESDVPAELLEIVVGAAHTHGAGQNEGPTFRDVQGMPEGQVGLVFHIPTKTLYVYDSTGYLTHTPYEQMAALV